MLTQTKTRKILKRIKKKRLKKAVKNIQSILLKINSLNQKTMHRKKMNRHAYVNFLKRLQNGYAQEKIKTQRRQMKMPQKTMMLQNRQK